MFDFDDLEEQLPVQMVRFDDVIRSARTDEGMDAAIVAELLQGAERTDVEKVTADAMQNLPRMVRAFVACLQERKAENPAALVTRLFHMSLSTTLCEVRVVQPVLSKGAAPSEGSLVVLLLGWGGSGVHELAPITEFYKAEAGATVISTTPMGGIPELQELQEKQIASALEAALLSDEGAPGRLVVHVMSNNGFFRWALFLAAWRGGDVGNGTAGCHFAALAEGCPLKSVLQGYVFDCCPDTRCEAGFMKQVLKGCFGGLSKRLEVPELWTWALSMDSEAVIEEVARIEAGRCPMMFQIWEEHDLPVPRLFLYSAKDRLIRPMYVDKHLSMLRQNKNALHIRAVQTSLSAHCQIFAQEADLYKKELGAFLGKPEISESSLLEEMRGA